MELRLSSNQLLEITLIENQGNIFGNVADVLIVSK